LQTDLGDGSWLAMLVPALWLLALPALFVYLIGRGVAATLRCPGPSCDWVVFVGIALWAVPVVVAVRGALAVRRTAFDHPLRRARARWTWVLTAAACLVAGVFTWSVCPEGPAYPSRRFAAERAWIVELGSPDPPERQAALTFLLSPAGNSPVDANEKRAAEAKASRRLFSEQPQVEPALVRLLADEDPLLRTGAAALLTRAGSPAPELPAALDALISYLATSPGGADPRRDGALAYEALRDAGGTTTELLMRAITGPEGYAPSRLQLVMLAIRLGIPGSEPRLAGLLDTQGDPGIAEAYLNHGSDALDRAARKWAAANDYQVEERRTEGTGSGGWGWGKP
jgi:hypothetical protein